MRRIAAPDFAHQLSRDAPALDIDGYCTFVAGFRAAFDPIDLLLHRTLVDDDRVVVHFSLTGNHVGELFGIAPTGASLWLPAMTFMHFRDAADGVRLARQSSLTDFLSLQRQLKRAS